MDFIEFWTICSANNIELDELQMENIRRFHKEIIYWNEKVNMISRKDIEHLLSRHILHSLSIMKYINFPQKARLVDVGTGGGFPGIPLKIANPDIYITLVDSISKKLKIANMLAQHTGLRNIEAKAQRIEEINSDKNYQYKFDFVVSRATASASKIYLWTQNMMKNTGKIILWKGGDLTDEINELLKQNSNLKVEVIDIDLFGFDYFKKEDKKFLIISNK
ncbi:MAG: 16S rRNA (guanine(527)-N(7))-methyltransferase RsmG [Candidatus Kapaibacteriota bacterium]